MMGTVLFKNADVVATMDATNREIANCDVLVRDNVIAEVGSNLNVAADETFDARGTLVIPGMINTHNHMWGTLYRGIPVLHGPGKWESNAGHLTKYMRDQPFTPDDLYAAALANMGKHLLTGCTTTSDHHWVYPKDQPLEFVDREIEAAKEIGMRFHPSRASMTLAVAKGGISDDFLETEDKVIKDAQRLIETYHDPKPYSMLRMILAPSAIYADTETIYREMRALSREHPKVLCNTHLYMGDSDRMSYELYGKSPIEFMEDVGWVGEDVVYYHLTTQDPDVLKRVKESRTSVSVCTAIDLFMGYCACHGVADKGFNCSAITPVRDLLDSGSAVSFGTSNPFMDTGTGMLGDMRVTHLANRVYDRERWITTRDLLRMATKEGARALGRDDIGSLEAGKAADLAIFDLRGIDMAGHHDPLTYITGLTQYTKATMVNGKFVVKDGRLLTVDQDQVARKANERAKTLVS